MIQLDKSGIRVAQYLTELPLRELLERPLHNSIRRARKRLGLTQQVDPAETFTRGIATESPRRKAAKAKNPRKAAKKPTNPGQPGLS